MFLAPFTAGGVAAAGAAVPAAGASSGGYVGGSSALGFAAVAPSTSDDVVVPDGYRVQVLIPWGDPIVPGGPAFRFDGTNTAAQQAKQFGMGHDGMHFFPIDRRRGLLVVNHEAVDDAIMFNAAPDFSDLETVRRHQAAHGVAVCELALQGGEWKVVASRRARRITPLTEMELTGPAAGSPGLRTPLDPSGRKVLGTVNNCANGATPWNTYLTCEENFNGYFGRKDGGSPSAQEQAYGIAAAPSSNKWYLADDRFDFGLNPGEPNRFGYVVEIDPFDARSKPKKRTALGRLKHENAAFAEAADGRAVIYTGDDERFQHLYKYVSARPWREMRRRNVSPLDEGTLYVARLDADGSGSWLPLTPATVPGFTNLADILIHTRTAARNAGATPMDRPEWVAVHPGAAGVAYGTFTNNTARTAADAANPRFPNPSGHILRWQNHGGDHGATGFVWSVFALAGSGLGTGDGSTIPPADFFGSPDGLAFDASGRLWIETDGSQPGACNNQMLAADPVSGDIRRFLVGPAGCEITGWTMTPDQRVLFVNIQHPGEGAVFGDPDAQSSWPDRAGRPRSATVAISRTNGAVVGA